MQHINPHFHGGIRSSKKELIDLLKSWLVIGVAFAIALNGASTSVAFFIAVFISLFTVGIGFLLHELAHKFVAQRYGCFAEFRSFDRMLIFALIVSLFGFIFAAPGAVMIQGKITRSQRGIISAAGPLTNMILALIFLFISASTTGILEAIGAYGFIINSWLALFNMIPFAMFDGKKVLDWNKFIYAGMAVASLSLIVVHNLILIGRL
ncbi:MAG: site-2 protease family protein [Candidatus Woesearchaeota archaeon]